MQTTSTPVLLTTKQAAHLGDLTLRCGQTLSDVTLGYETYGTLNAAKDNVVLICHYFSGASHAAGRYSADDPLPGWWDAVIGPGKAIDTDRWFVLAVDALGCVRIDAPHTVTTGPQSINPATGMPYGPDFPPLHVTDSVHAQRQLLAQFGISRLAAVAGPSYGAMQALAWATTYPEMVERVIAAIAPAELQAREIGFYAVMRDAIRLDPKFLAGRYSPDAPPAQGLATALKLMILLAGGRVDFDLGFGRRPAPEGSDHATAMETWLEQEAITRSRVCDANAWIRMLEANIGWDLAEGFLSLRHAFKDFNGRVLLIPGARDELLPSAHYHVPLMQALAEAGVAHDVCLLPPEKGHLAGLGDIDRAADAIRRCLETPAI